MKLKFWAMRYSRLWNIDHENLKSKIVKLWKKNVQASLEKKQRRIEEQKISTIQHDVHVKCVWILSFKNILLNK